ncbi:MAG: ATP-binding protein [Spirochaetaceae bacterium]|jgi:hypothetical protein|nr:ATP-binding protein [Spirochaetaceae bacterium]
MKHSCLGDIVIDIAQNAACSGADLLELEIDGRGAFGFTIRDNGRGMAAEQVTRIKRAAADYAKGAPLPETARGRGIPLMARAAEESGGSWELDSEEGKGTRVSARFGPADAPAPPPERLVGDIPGTLRTALLFEGPEEVVIKRIRGDGTVYEIRKTELTRILGEPEKARVMILLDRYLREIEGGLRLNAD